ncbi:ferredoxin-type protein NapF [Shimia gijangensis]|uniref:Ferredoxin-type protein NapF n=1 Tax=Shimia gijangensis TaxID=1470563 RepID=A0A1M6JV04_9RHOB|nr:ferredoxin-type protein NapF [Shimia gijangensis]SHJ50528.1 ferredoxin-type protein NapF [Shimia gijangensis]
MTSVPSRRAFLRGRFEAPAVMRPFGAIAEQTFHNTCTSCGDCVSACPESILFKGEGGLPYVNFSQDGCTFCGDCIEACETGALVADQPWLWSASIASTCLSEKGVQCRTCQDHCDERAIRFQLVPGGREKLELNSSLCTGCGYCVAPCPVNAISLTQFTPSTEASRC